jgi:hypothetical protein
MEFREVVKQRRSLRYHRVAVDHFADRDGFTSRLAGGVEGAGVTRVALPNARQRWRNCDTRRMRVLTASGDMSTLTSRPPAGAGYTLVNSAGKGGIRGVARSTG